MKAHAPTDAIVDFAGLPFVAMTPSDAAEWVIQTARAGVPADIHYINANNIALAQDDATLRECHEQASANFADGRPIELLSPRLAHATIPQVRGPQAFELVMDRGRAHELRHFLLGSTEQTLAALRESLTTRYPGVQIVGVESPPYRPLSADEYAAQDRRIAETAPHIVWVGLGAPKQDVEAARLAEAGFVAAAVGAAFDFSAGTKSEAPDIFRRLGVEWLFRLVTEPRRLWRRYLIGNPKFLLAAWRRRAR